MRILETNILDVPFGNIVHFVNCKGVWGAGLAAQIKQMYPEAFASYKKLVDNTRKPYLLLGSNTIESVDMGSKNIISSFTQFDVGVTARKTEYCAVVSCIKSLAKLNKQLYLPYKVGCGLGGGDWNIVSEIIETYLPNAIICKHG